MTKRAKIIAGLLMSILVGVLLLIAVGVFMVRSTLHQNKILDALEEEKEREKISDSRAQEDRDLIIANSARVQAVTDCILASQPPPFRDCLANRLPKDSKKQYSSNERPGDA